MTILNGLREAFKMETTSKAGRLTKYIRAALAVYLISMATMEACQCATDYDTDMISSETAERIINTLQPN